MMRGLRCTYCINMGVGRRVVSLAKKWNVKEKE